MPKILINMPEGFLKIIDEYANAQYMSRSEFIRAALRYYIKYLDDN